MSCLGLLKCSEGEEVCIVHGLLLFGGLVVVLSICASDCCTLRLAFAFGVMNAKRGRANEQALALLSR